ncbi:MAG TPA: hypothetical protein VGR57_04575, partial [Ktedonobacterales bacterium]|nr:hypothetical protein [Ktedonobacterales bacterium]
MATAAAVVPADSPADSDVLLAGLAGKASEIRIPTLCPHCGKERGADAYRGGHELCRWCRMIANRGPARPRKPYNKQRPAVQPGEEHLTPFQLPSERIALGPQAYAASGSMRHCPLCGEDKTVALFARHPTIAG